MSSTSTNAVFFLAVATAAVAAQSGRIDPTTLVATPHGTFQGVRYTQYEAMFDGVTSNQRRFRVPCQIVAPERPGTGSGLLLFDWLVPSTIVTLVGQEQADARYTMTDRFLFNRGVSYATVRCNPEGLGQRSPRPDATRPWSDGTLDTATEFITSPGDEFDIVVAYVTALRTDPVAVQLLGPIRRRAAFGYSASGGRVRGLLRLQMAIGLFDFALVGGNGSGYDHPTGNEIKFSKSEKPPLAGAGLEIDFQSETDVILFDGQKARYELPNYRNYEFAGAAHIRDIDAVEFGLADPELANPARWEPFIRTLFVAGDNWCDGVRPPPSLWLGAPDDPQIVRDAKGNALVTHVGGQRINPTGGYRLPEVAVGQNQYIPIDPSYLDGSFLGVFRFLGGSHVDLTGSFTSHAGYVSQITFHARALEAQGYLLAADANWIIDVATSSNIGGQ